MCINTRSLEPLLCAGKTLWSTSITPSCCITLVRRGKLRSSLTSLRASFASSSTPILILRYRTLFFSTVAPYPVLFPGHSHCQFYLLKNWRRAGKALTPTLLLLQATIAGVRGPGPGYEASTIKSCRSSVHAALCGDL